MALRMTFAGRLVFAGALVSLCWKREGFPQEMWSCSGHPEHVVSGSTVCTSEFGFSDLCEESNLFLAFDSMCC